MRRGLLAAAALAAVAICCAAPAGAPAATRGPALPPALFEVPDPGTARRDAVLAHPKAGPIAAARAQRYPVNDGEGRTVAISVSPFCNALTCNAADPQQIADFLGTLLHGDEISLLTVELLTSGGISSRCGFAAGACYFAGADTMLVNGSDSTGPDGATREFVIAHEFGHHVANHRLNPPFGPAIDWGPKRWATYERVCQGARAGFYFPGDEREHYFQNPGEAFAEAFAFNRFRQAPVRWAWSDSLEPGRGAFRALRADTLARWRHRTRFALAGVAGERVGSRAPKPIRTPLDGVLGVRLRAAPGAQLDLVLRDPRGRVLASSRTPGSREELNFTVCGQARLRAVVERTGRGRGAFTLIVRRP